MTDKLRSALIRLPRRYKRLLQVTVDVVLVWAALWLAFIVRLGFDKRVDPLGDHLWLFTAAPLIAIPLFIRTGMYRAVMRYFGNDALVAIFKAVSISALVLALVVYWHRDPPAVVPRSLVFNYWWLSLFMVGGLRLLMRHYFMGDWYVAGRQMPVCACWRRAIFGASSGRWAILLGGRSLRRRCAGSRWWCMRLRGCM